MNILDGFVPSFERVLGANKIRILKGHSTSHTDHLSVIIRIQLFYLDFFSSKLSCLFLNGSESCFDLSYSLVDSFLCLGIDY